MILFMVGNIYLIMTIFYLAWIVVFISTALPSSMIPTLNSTAILEPPRLAPDSDLPRAEPLSP